MNDTDDMDSRRRAGAWPPRWLMFLMVCLIAIGSTAEVGLQVQSLQEKQAAQANTQTLAQAVKRQCTASGTLATDPRGICTKATQAQQDPSAVIPGPRGPAGPAPASFTFTDQTGRVYTCVPNPPASDTYTCSAN